MVWFKIYSIFSSGSHVVQPMLNFDQCFRSASEGDAFSRYSLSGALMALLISGAESFVQRIIDGLGLIRIFFLFPERCFWASSVVHVVSVQ